MFANAQKLQAKHEVNMFVKTLTRTIFELIKIM